MTNEELLERCANVMGKKILFDRAFESYRDVTGADPAMNFLAFPLWNPLTSIADAADMAIKMKVDVCWFLDRVSANPSQGWGGISVVQRPPNRAGSVLLRSVFCCGSDWR